MKNVFTIYIGPVSSEINKTQSQLIKPNISHPGITVDTQNYHRRYDLSYYWSSDKQITEYALKIMENLRHMLEEANEPILTLMITCDISDGLSSSILTSLLQLLHHFCPDISVLVINLSIHTIVGNHVFNTTIGGFYCLEYADSILFRDLNSLSWMISPDSTLLLSSSSASSSSSSSSILHSNQNNSFDLKSYPGVDFSDMLMVSACDFHILQKSLEINSFDKIEDILSTTKIFDIQTSYWKARKNTNKRSGLIEYNALRSLGNSIHSIELSMDRRYHKNVPKSIFYSLQESLDRKHYRIMKPSYSSVDIRVTLEWAAPELHWPNPNLISSSSNSYDDSSIHSNHEISQAYQNTEIACSVMDSPYGLESLRKVVGATERFIEAKAYLHNSDCPKVNRHVLEMDCIELQDICNDISNFLDTY